MRVTLFLRITLFGQKKQKCKECAFCLYMFCMCCTERELPATYARHTAPGSGGASAPWSLSFPAYEESSLQDDCNHPNLTISTGDPRRPVRFIHNEGLSFLCVRMSGCACHPFRLIQDILCCLLIPVHGMSAYRAEIRPVRQL